MRNNPLRKNILGTFSGEDRQSNVGTILITGISASGKSTMGKRLLDNLLQSGFASVNLLDGEEIRQRLQRSGKQYGYSTADRNTLAMEIADIASDLNEKGWICIVCIIAHVRETRRRIRERIDNFMEVYLDCPVHVCQRRDQKGHYSRAFAGLYDNFIGVTEPYQPSDNVELTLNTDRKDVDECSEILFNEVVKFLRNGCKKA